VRESKRVIREVLTCCGDIGELVTCEARAKEEVDMFFLELLRRVQSTRERLHGEIDALIRTRKRKIEDLRDVEAEMGETIDVTQRAVDFVRSRNADGPLTFTVPQADMLITAAQHLVQVEERIDCRTKAALEGLVPVSSDGTPMIGSKHSGATLPLAAPHDAWVSSVFHYAIHLKRDFVGVDLDLLGVRDVLGARGGASMSEDVARRGRSPRSPRAGRGPDVRRIQTPGMT
jgi:hypothetical protein